MKRLWGLLSLFPLFPSSLNLLKNREATQASLVTSPLFHIRAHQHGIAVWQKIRLKALCPGDVAVRIRKGLARPWVGVPVCHLLLLRVYYRGSYIP